MASAGDWTPPCYRLTVNNERHHLHFQEQKNFFEIKLATSFFQCWTSIS
jgi:hypothetical protein